MKKALKIIICLVVAALMTVGFYKLELYSKGVSADEIKASYEKNSGLIETLAVAPKCYELSGQGVKSTKTTDEINNEIKAVLHSAIGDEKYYIVDCTRFVPYKTESNGHILWLVTAHISGIPDYRSAIYFTTVYDETLNKIVTFYCDYVTEKDGDTYLYEEVARDRYHPEKSSLYIAQKKADEYTKLFAEYLGMKVNAVTFDHYNLDRYTFKAELSDSENNTVTVDVSYNVNNSRYNFNF